MYRSPRHPNPRYFSTPYFDPGLHQANTTRRSEQLFFATRTFYFYVLSFVTLILGTLRSPGRFVLILATFTPFLL